MSATKTLNKPSAKASPKPVANPVFKGDPNQFKVDIVKDMEAAKIAQSELAIDEKGKIAASAASAKKREIRRTRKNSINCWYYSNSAHYDRYNNLFLFFKINSRRRRFRKMLRIF